jgi:tetratricopeptide (TPR) repeat protein
LARCLESARIYERLGEIYYLSNERERLVHALLSTLNLAERAGPTPELARAYANSCFVAGLAHLHWAAKTYAQNGQEIARIVDDPAASAWVLEVMGIYNLGMGRLEEAQRPFTQAFQITEQIGDWQHWGTILAADAQAEYYAGKTIQGRLKWCELHSKATSRGDELQQAWGLNGRAEAHLRLGGDGHAEQAVECLKEALRLYDKNVDRVSQFGSYGLLALARWRQRDVSSALKAAHAGMQLAIELAAPTGYYTLNGYFGVARTYLALWESADQGSPPNTPRLAVQACRALERYARTFPVGRPGAAICRGLASWLAGRKRSALSTWKHGVRVAQRIGMPFEQGVLHYEIARHLDRAHPDCQMHLSLACELFERADAVFDQTRARDLLNTVP